MNGKNEKRNGGEGGIRTPGTVLPVQRFSKPPPSATRPPLHQSFGSRSGSRTREGHHGIFGDFKSSHKGKKIGFHRKILCSCRCAGPGGLQIAVADRRDGTVFELADDGGRGQCLIFGPVLRFGGGMGIDLGIALRQMIQQFQQIRLLHMRGLHQTEDPARVLQSQTFQTFFHSQTQQVEDDRVADPVEQRPPSQLPAEPEEIPAPAETADPT